MRLGRTIPVFLSNTKMVSVPAPVLLRRPLRGHSEVSGDKVGVLGVLLSRPLRGDSEVSGDFGGTGLELDRAA